MTFNDNIIRADWGAMDAAQQREYFGDNGFVVVPNALSKEEVAHLLQEISAHNISGFVEELWDVPAMVALITNAAVLGALANMLSDDLRFFKAAYVEAPPGRERQNLHLDRGITWETDARNSCASWINVGFYLTDLSPEHSPLWVVPGSNKCYHLVPSVGGENLEPLIPQAKMVLARAGDAVLFHCSTVHAGGANCSQSTRHGVFLSYRPAWAKPTSPIPEWPDSLVEKISLSHRALLLGLNDGF